MIIKRTNIDYPIGSTTMSQPLFTNFCELSKVVWKHKNNNNNTNSIILKYPAAFMIHLCNNLFTNKYYITTTPDIENIGEQYSKLRTIIIFKKIQERRSKSIWFYIFKRISNSISF